MRRAKALLLFALATSVAATSAFGATSTSSKSSWNPFNKSKAKTQINAGKSSSNSIPVVSSVSNGSKKLVSNTKSMLTPKKAPVKRSGTTAVRPAQPAKPKQDQPGIFSRMFKSDPSPPPKTIKEWMSLKQVHP